MYKIKSQRFGSLVLDLEHEVGASTQEARQNKV